jgi:hypothetical protein
MILKNKIIDLVLYSKIIQQNNLLKFFNTVFLSDLVPLKLLDISYCSLLLWNDLPIYLKFEE